MTVNCSGALPVQEISASVQFANATSIGFWNMSNTAGACGWTSATCRNDTVVELILQGREACEAKFPHALGILHT
ncbi:hypothetical protein TL16_g11487 [Triparma laevis f. inornata]|uniref:Uncharacterized protein n=2 Tax=Triparma laevis TaxID=1534972 RepID=A0A9W7KZK6_9STRA|nr:hypothetical protein TL16_g11487 [Triparma laevis f. inornata]GMI17733.1 hypothetical protein TrLO_g14836 [Triparma laevis f. longispina]